MDIRMSNIDGIEATSMLLHEKPDTRILMATVIEDPVVHMNAMLAGAGLPGLRPFLPLNR